MMSNTSATRPREPERARAAPRGSSGGRLLVGEYVGQAAGEAAQAVRRAGLRPSLDRSFGYAPDLVGSVVAQEPPAGSDLGRNGLVTLYVAAPGLAAPDGDGGDGLPELRDPVADALPPAAASPSPRVEPRARRPRKPGRAARAPHVFETPLAPVPPVFQPATETLERDAEADWAEDWECGSSAPSWGQQPRDEIPDELAVEQFMDEEFVVHVDDLFAGRVGGSPPAWRRLYPRRPPRGLRAGLRARRRRATTKGGV